MPRLNIVPQLKSAQLSTLTDQLEYLNLDKVGEVSVKKKRTPNDDRGQFEECSVAYHKFYEFLFKKVRMERIRKLEIGIDFVCVDCRKLLQLESARQDRFSTFDSILPNLQYLKLRIFTSNSVNPTCGLYAYFVKKILQHERLKHLQLVGISDEIFEELKTWFHESRSYFRTVRNFELSASTELGTISLVLYPIGLTNPC